MRSARFACPGIIILSACSSFSAATIERADVAIRNANGRDLGTLAIANGAGGLLVTGTLYGLPPGTHGIHIHTTGQCEPPFESAGGHWNPMSRMHGAENQQGPHLGDMANITVSPDSSATVNVRTAGGTLRGAYSLLDDDGAAVVIHAAPDDYRTDPSGNSGNRIACGVARGR